MGRRSGSSPVTTSVAGTTGRSNPEVELIRDGETVAHLAAALDTVEAREHVIGLMKKGAGSSG